MTPRRLTRREARAVELAGRAAGVLGVHRPNPDASTAKSYAVMEARVLGLVTALVETVHTSEEALSHARSRARQAEATLAQLTTPSPTTPEPETVPL